MTTIQFEVIEVRAKKAASLDKVIRVVLETNEEQALSLQDYILDRPIVIKIVDGEE